jgi:Family of unknown function (DUF6148)
MPTRLEVLKNRLQQYLDCEAAILSGAQEYSIGSRRLTRADLSEIAEMIRYLEREIANEEAKVNGKGRNRVIGIIPRDL